MWPLFSRKTRRQTRTRQARDAHRPHVEVLEDRCVPSTAGSLDPTFGNGAGYVTTSTTAFKDGASTALVQPNGDIIAVGGANTSSTSRDFAVERYTPDGTLDTTFGSGGVVLTSFGSGAAHGPSGALYPQEGSANDGKIIEEGDYNNAQLALARYNANGTLDTTFGNGGEVLTAIPGVSYISAPNGGCVVLTGNGQIVAFGMDDTSGQFVLARYNSDGSLDTTFGQGGFVITTTPNRNTATPNTDLLQEQDGTLIVTEGAVLTTGNAWAMYAYNANGTQDTSFGNQGVVTTAAAGTPMAAAIYPHSGTANDGQIVLVGQQNGTANAGPVELARYNANGSLDTTFGIGGLLQTQLNTGEVIQATVDASGRIVVTGTVIASADTTTLARFNVNGAPDTAFGTGGLVTTLIGPSSQGLGLAVYPNAGTANDGEIAVVGVSTYSGKNNVAVARYLGQATSPYFTITGPASVTAGAAGTYTINVFNPDGSADTTFPDTVHVTSSDPQAVLPADFTITGGTATFTATLKTAGLQSLTATDTVTSSITGSDASIPVSPGAATHFVLSGPSSVRSGSAFSLTLTALDAYGNVATGYLGTVKFSDSVSGATLPGNYAFTAGDAGVHTFTGVKLKTRGYQTITVVDTANNTILGTLTIDVT
jgi:uncharacterized delta-60 repeat protein